MILAAERRGLLRTARVLEQDREVVGRVQRGGVVLAELLLVRVVRRAEERLGLLRAARLREQDREVAGRAQRVGVVLAELLLLRVSYVAR